jgi:probable rRNA maturation factor
MSQYNIEIQMETDEATPAAVEVTLVNTAVAVLQHEEITPPAELTILLTGDDDLRQMNRDYLGIDAVTDVLSFPAGEAMPGMEESGIDAYLGDIAISVPQAQRQATAAGHTLLAELQLLTVHGTLHLLGYDHADPAEKAAMWSAQAAILQALGSGITGPGEQADL